MTRPLVSVVIPNWNGERFIETCLVSLATQTYPAVEVLVVDNGSTDRSIALARRALSAVRIISLGKNMGFSAAVNVGIRSSTGDFVFVLNNDTVVSDDCIEELVAAAGRLGQHAAFSPRILPMSEEGLLYAAGLMYSHRGYGNRSQRWTLVRQTDEIDLFGFCGAAALLRRESLADVGEFNEHFFVLHEDVEMSFRLQLKGYHCRYVPAAVVRHIGSGTIREHGRLVVRETVKNSVFTVLTCAPSEYLRRYWPKMLRFHLALWWTLGTSTSGGPLP